MILAAVLTCLLLADVKGSLFLQPSYDEIGSDGITLSEDASSYTKLYLFTKETGESTGENFTEIIVGNLSSLSNLDVSKPTKVLIHGWLRSAFNNAEAALREAYLSAAADLNVNLVSVDWSKVGDNWFYPVARYAVVPVGKFLAEVVDWMVSEAGVSVDSIHVIGHSLGAQISGVIGEHVTVGKLGRISGLDPAGPLFFNSSTSGRLDSSDAQFVDVIHTCGHWAGYYEPCGHVDFYPNRGMYNQPGCSLDIGRCSHIRAYLLYAESIFSRGFVSTPCDRWKDFAKGVCDGNDTIVMGEYVDTSASGKYYLYTAGSSPYALGGNTTTLL